jgi:hypothetical protein
MIIGYDDRTVRPFSVSCAQANFTQPIENLLNPNPNVKWQSINGAAEILFDVGAEIACNLVACRDANLQPTGFVALDVSDEGFEQFSRIAIATASERGGFPALDYAIATAPAVSRYWRVVVDTQSATDLLQLSNIFFGSSFRVSPPASTGVDTTFNFQRSESYNFGEINRVQRSKDFALQILSDDEMKLLVDIYANNVRKNVVYIENENDNSSARNFLGRLNSSPIKWVNLMGKTQTHRAQMSVSEVV